MKIISNARLTCMQQQIISKAETIRELNREISRLENENRMQAERIAELEALLFAAGVLDKDGQMKATDADKRWYASQVLERYEGTPLSALLATSPEGGSMRDVEDIPTRVERATFPAPPVPYGEEVQA